MASKFGGVQVAEETPSRFGGVAATDGAPTVVAAPAPVAPAPSEAVAPPAAPQDVGFGEFMEPALTIGSSIVAEPLAGIAGIFQVLNPFADEGAGAEAVEATRKALTFQPRSESGKKVLGEVGGVLEPVGEAFEGVSSGLGETVLDATGSPLLATMAHSAPTAIAELLGLKGLKALKPFTKLLDKGGRPTRALKKALNKRGLDFDNLSPEVKQLIPEEVSPGHLPGGNSAADEAEKAIRRQIETGAKDDALAGLKVEGGSVVADRPANAVIKQGLEPGMVQTIKTATPATRKKMLNMARRMRRIKKQARLGTEIRPSDVVGDAVTERITFIRDKADIARTELNKIAHKKLPGKKVETAPLLDTLEKALGDLDVRLVEGPNGTTVPDFVGSMISKDKASRRVVTDLLDLLMEPVKPDALRFHKLKRQIDAMLEFRKKSSTGLTAAGENTAKTVRRQLNESIRAVDPDYARVNDVLSESLDALGGLDDAVGTIDIFGPGANKALGTKMRTLLSNQQGRITLDNALNSLDKTASNLGSTFTDNVKDLVLFSDALDAKFGTTAKTSFAGQIEQATTRALSQSPQATVVGKGAEAVGRGVEKLRGINDFNAFESIEALLTRGK